MESGSSDHESPFEYESLLMKLPFQTLAVLLFFVGSPIGLMKLTSNAIETPKTYPLMSVAPGPGFAACEAIGQTVERAIAPNRLAYRAITELVGKSTSLNRFRQFVDATCVGENTAYMDSLSSAPIDGLIIATERAIAASFREMQPTLVALPTQLRRLNQHRGLANLQTRAINYVASRPAPTHSPLPGVTRQIPGLIRATERAVLSSWREIQPAVVAMPSRFRNAPGTTRVARVVENYRSHARVLRGIGNLLQTSMDNR